MVSSNVTIDFIASLLKFVLWTQMIKAFICN